MRVDQLLVQRGLAPSRSAAQRLIQRGAVRWLGAAGWSTPRKAGEELPADCELEVADDAELRWVSRGGLKLEGALAATGLDLAGRSALDVGQSTGGFTHVLLARGAGSVVGVDVGHGQLHPSLRADARVRAFEGLNARQLQPQQLGDAMPPEGFGFITGDLSFISLTLVLPALSPLLAPNGDLLMLVKPQFELQPADIGKGGLVKDAAAYARVEQRLRQACAGCGLHVQGWLDSPVTGGDGNREFFVWARPARQGDLS
ncbi:TlyA family RNA methyltransferase [Azohydromonas caseinilytica]|uniref:TlyA family RNA methyltransferase n=1 Tax=Azohydromonas caseinilytica TaxID=2728836 RepID=A0A848F4T7_9BURK|nr:TlyA family RNA methyltransferase [Azohydromonas caseinilytica]NML13629.1 TlyA family RNA methyltransferase [Azohydromonas caseinilytica]